MTLQFKLRSQYPMRVKNPNSSLLQELTPSVGSLTAKTMADVSTFFQTRNHHPNLEMLHALTSVAATLEAMANEICPQQIHLSSLDPGVGKTQTIVHFIRSLLSSEVHSNISVILCVSRLDEIKGLIDSMQLSRDQFSVLTSDADLNDMGVSADQGRILFTTHRMVEVRCDGRSFDEVSELHWSGCPRQVRIWDEAILPGQIITVTRDDIASMLKPVRSRHPVLADALEVLFGDIRSQADRSIIELPDFASVYGLELDQLLQCVEGQPDALVNSARSLWLLGGKAVTIRQDGKFGHTILDYRNTLPTDIAPLLVLDASGRVRTVYKHWEERRGGLVQLPSAIKKYGNLKVHVWGTGGSKSAYAGKLNHLADGIASTIRLRPDEEWLVVHHKVANGRDIKASIRSLLTGPTDNVHFINWGSHDATNRFSHVPNVILAGTLFYRSSYYESLGRLASNLPSSKGHFPEEDEAEIMLGEHRHLILQALCRGSVRRSDGEDCQPCNAYIIASTASGIKQAIPGIFPGCQLLSWRPLKVALKGKVAEAVAFITTWPATSNGHALPFRTVSRAIGMDSSNFRRSVRQHVDFIEALAAEGIIEGKGGFLRCEDFFPDE